MAEPEAPKQLQIDDIDVKAEKVGQPGMKKDFEVGSAKV